MNIFEGYLRRKKLNFKENKLKGIALYATKSFDSDKDGLWFNFWLNSEEDHALYGKYKLILDKLEEPHPTYKIKIWYTTNEKGFHNLEKFELHEASKIDSAFESESCESPDLPEQPEAVKELYDKEIEEKKVSQKVNLTDRDLIIARESVMRGTESILELKERIETMKRLMKFIETGE